MTPSVLQWALSVNCLLYTSMPFPLFITALWGSRQSGSSNWSTRDWPKLPSIRPVRLLWNDAYCYFLLPASGGHRIGLSSGVCSFAVPSCSAASESERSLSVAGCTESVSQRRTALSPDNVDNILLLRKIGLILQIPINRPKVLLLFAYRTMTILTISVLDCCCLIIDWRHLCKTLFFIFCLRAGPETTSGRGGPGHEISARAEL